MEKRVVSSLGVHQIKPTKRIEKRRGILRRAINYMKSDTHMFAPLLSFQPSDFSFPTPKLPSVTFSSAMETIIREEEDDKKLVGKIVKYLKSDDYMYAPLVNYRPSLSSASNVMNLHEEPEGCGSEREAGKISVDKNVTVKTKEPVEMRANVGTEDTHSDGSVRGISRFRRTLVHRETVKHMVQHNLCSPPIPAKGFLGTERRKVVGD